MKRLANLKESKKNHGASSKSKKTSGKNNNPYPESGIHRPANKTANDQVSFSEPATDSASYTSREEDEGSADPRRAVTRSNKSTAPTVATNPETVNSDISHGKAGTARSANFGANSTFSSPNHSERSLTTTLTTIQSTAPSALLGQPNGNGHSSTNNNSIQFAHQYPVSPASAIPAHLAPHPHSYQAATANGVLTDNASILTLASSSKRRRRNSLDEDASVRALAPSSVWGGSRESLPLSVLSDRVDLGAQRTPAPLGGYASTERASVYSASGAQHDRPVPDNRSSYYASKAIDNSSVRSGKIGHGRSESVTGSIGGVAASSPLASPSIAGGQARSLHARSAEWREGQVEDVDDNGSDNEEERPRTRDTGKGKSHDG